jgi:hypothetical protein
MHGDYNLNPDDFFFGFFTAKTSGHFKRLKMLLLSHLKIRETFLTRRVVNTWNSLGDSIVSAPNIHTFKTCLLRRVLKN